MLKSNLHPPHDGLNADPILYGVAAGLAELFPPIDTPKRPAPQSDQDRSSSRDRRDEVSCQE